MSKKTFSIVVLIFVMSLVVSIKSAMAANILEENGNTVYEFLVSHSGNEQSANQYCAARAGELMLEKSGGRLRMKIYPNSTLGKTRESIEGLVAGDIDFVPYVSAGYVEFVPECALFDMPSVAPSLSAMRLVFDEITDAMKPYFEENGMKFFGFTDSGFREMTSSKPVRKMEDFQNLKVRTMENKNHIMYWKAIGTNPTPMDFSEVFIGLQQGIIDAQETPLENPVDMKFYEVQKYVVFTNHIVFNMIMPMSLVTFEKLPPDLQKIAEECLVQANIDTRLYADKRMQNDINFLRDVGKLELIYLSDDVHAQMKEAAKETYDEIRKQVGNELVDKYLAAADKAMKK